MLETAAALKTIIDSGLPHKVTQLITTVKTSKDKEKIINTYEETFNQLIEENQQLKSIALTYKDEYDQLHLSEQDIQYLQQTAARLIKMFLPEFSEEDENSLKHQGYTDDEIHKHKDVITKQRDDMLSLIDLIQVDTLRTMQLLGYNYKKAIGEPLTELTAQSLISSVKSSSDQ